MADFKKKLAGMYRKEERYANFGPIINKIKLTGFRGLLDVTVICESPITAFCGLNGSGKSTLGQLFTCGYKKLSTDINSKRFYIADFFRVSQLDPSPVASDAFIEYYYATSKPGQDQVVTVKRAVSEWSGYKRQPERKVSYVGFNFYIPKVERKDFSVYQAHQLTVLSSRQPNEETIQWTQRILGNTYSGIGFTTVGHKDKQLEVGCLEKNGAQYSESNMGFGEGRIMYLVDALENSPLNSLFVIEEPETSLHPVAEYNFAQYLLDVVSRKKHQVIMSTHSENLLSGLPQESRKFIQRQNGQTKIIDNISATYVKSFLFGGYHPALTICVEDEFAKTLLTELVRVVDSNILKHIAIKPAGDSKAVATTVGILCGNGINSIAIRDADKGENIPQKLYKLPGGMAPETEVIECASVRGLLEDTYKLNIGDFLRMNSDIDHHDYFRKIAEEVKVEVHALEVECIRKYLQTVSSTEKEAIVVNIRQHL